MMRKSKNFVINGDSVVIIHQQIVQYVIIFVLVFKHINAYGVIEQNMDHVLIMMYNVILEV